jgi:hypothetical protein
MTDDRGLTIFYRKALGMQGSSCAYILSVSRSDFLPFDQHSLLHPNIAIIIYEGNIAH